MSIINSPRKSRLRVARIALIPAVAVGLIGGPVAAAGPATASTSERGCTVDPLKPVKRDHKDNNKVRVDFRIYVDCNGNKKVEIRQLRFEDDRGRNDDFLGKDTFWKSFDPRDDAVTIHSYDRVPNWTAGAPRRSTNSFPSASKAATATIGPIGPAGKRATWPESTSKSSSGPRDLAPRAREPVPWLSLCCRRSWRDAARGGIRLPPAVRGHIDTKRRAAVGHFDAGSRRKVPPDRRASASCERRAACGRNPGGITSPRTGRPPRPPSPGG